MEATKLSYINGPFIKKNTILYRQYQQDIFNKCKNENSLVILPTGLGKTIIGILLIAHALQKYPEGKILVLAPTRPLISQHYNSCKKFLLLNENNICSITGRNSPDQRIGLFNNSKIIISTPQVIKNDLERDRYNLNYVSLLIFDEAHRTKGNYSYNFISNEYVEGGCSDPMLLGLTASPGKDLEHIQQICNNLYIEKVIYKSHEDEDVKEYFYDIDIIVESVDLDIKSIELREIWNDLFNKVLRFFIGNKIISIDKKYFSKLTFLNITRDIILSLKFENDYGLDVTEDELIDKLVYQEPKIMDIIREKNLNIQTIFSHCSSCISILHAKELLETQDIRLFKSFLEKIKYKSEHNIRSAERIVKTKHFKLINSILDNKKISRMSHPKIIRIKSIIHEEIEHYKNKKIIIFTQYREMAEILKNYLNVEMKGKLIFEKFIGQSSRADDIGYSQIKQSEIINKFRNDEIDVLIATSVAEEGLDIPNVESIIFYEPVPSEIRTIQRRGRTGRFSNGRCYILITEGTVDEPFYKVALRKENTMKEVLQNPESLILCDNLSREKIKFPSNLGFNQDLLSDYKARKLREKKYLANRTIDEIINELDNFKKSKEYNNLKSLGMTLFSDLLNSKENQLRKKIMKIKSKNQTSQNVKKKVYLNKNLKTLINLAEIYSNNGVLEYLKLQQLAMEEDIVDKKFFIHFNQACTLGYLRKDHSKVYFVKSFNQ